MYSPKTEKNALSRRFVRTIVVALSAFALVGNDLSPRRSLSELRNLCKTYFKHNEWDAYWEDIYGEYTHYVDDGDRSLIPNDPHYIGYALTLTHCPGDGYEQGVETQYDPGHAFYDAAALLKYSIESNTYPAGSRYNATMYAIVHPKAVRCATPNGEEYDRVKVLQELGYHVAISGHPVGQGQIKDEYVKKNIGSDSGIRDLMKLHAYSMEQHPAIVMVDFTTLVLKPLDGLFDSFIKSPDQQIAFSFDYPSKPPSTGSNLGVNPHFVVIKPNPKMITTILDAYKSTSYDAELGWNKQGIKDFDGVLGLKGFLFHYFTRIAPGSIRSLDRCTFGNDNVDPFVAGKFEEVSCKDPKNCADCRDLSVDSDITVLKMIKTCGEPWKCHFDEEWDPITKKTCEGFHRTWFSMRVDFEESCWHNGPPSYRTGDFRPDIFLGYCSKDGIRGYDRMIDDKAAPAICDPDTQAVSEGASLTFKDKFGQDRIQKQRLSMRTGKVTGSPTACVSGTIAMDGFEPPYNLGIVIDVSGSTAAGFSGTPTGDVNGDGKANNILDAQIQSIIKVMEHISASAELGNHNVNIGLVKFSTAATYMGQFVPSDPNNPSVINPDLKTALMTLRSGGWTHFDDALDKIIDYYDEAPKDRSNLLFFLSDGYPNVPGDGDGEMSTRKYNNNPDAIKFDSEIKLLDAHDVMRVAIGVGGKSDIRPGMGLDKIDNTINMDGSPGPEQVMSTDELTEVLLRNPLKGSIIDFGVEVNGVSQGGINKDFVKPGPTGFTFGTFVITGLEPEAGKLNKVTAQMTIDYDGNPATTSDQAVISTSAEIPGALV